MIKNASSQLKKIDNNFVKMEDSLLIDIESNLGKVKCIITYPFVFCSYFKVYLLIISLKSKYLNIYFQSSGNY